MHGEKTIERLNEKTWYRLVKVIYVLFFLVSLLVLNLGYFLFGNSVKKVDSKATQIQCSFQDKKAFSFESLLPGFNLSVNDFIDEKFDYEHFFRGYNEYEIKNILKKCYTPLIDDNIDIFVLQRYYEIAGLKEDKKEYSEDYLNSEIKKIESGYKIDSQKADMLDFSIKLFTINPVFSYSFFVSFFIIGNLSLILFFELVKRIFYYVVLGRVFPRSGVVA